MDDSDVLGHDPARPVARFFTKRLTWTGQGWNSGLQRDRQQLSELMTGNNNNNKKKENKKTGLY